MLGVVQLTSIERHAADVRTNWLSSISKLGAMSTAARDARVKLCRLATASDDATAYAENHRGLMASLDKLAELRSAYEQLESSAEEKAVYDPVRSNWNQYKAKQRAVVALMEENRQWEAFALLKSAEVTALAIQTAQALQRTVEFNRDGALGSIGATVADAASAKLAAYPAIALALLVAIGPGLFALFGITRPLARMTDAMGRLAAGDAETIVPGIGRGAEFGAMAGAVQVFKDNLIRTRALETALARARAETQRKAAMREMADGFERAVGGIVGAVTAAATEL